MTGRPAASHARSQDRWLVRSRREPDREGIVNHWGKILLGIAVTGALLWWTLSGVALSEVFEAIREGNATLLLAAAFVATTGCVIRAIRWKILLAAVKPDTKLG